MENLGTLPTCSRNLKKLDKRENVFNFGEQEVTEARKNEDSKTRMESISDDAAADGESEATTRSEKSAESVSENSGTQNSRFDVFDHEFTSSR